MKLKLPHSTQNWVSLVGATIALISFFMIVFLFTVSSIIGKDNSYLGLIIYIALPAVLVFGLILIPVGMWLKIRKEKRYGVKETKDWPTIDFNDLRTRNAFMIFSVGTAIFLLASAVGSYEAFHYTESVEFCGKVCHSVMKPEYVAYQNSPHARVACVECHVGTGASWYVRSKMSGLYQVYAVTLGAVPKPIETPIKNLRPARETCEECHWPQKFYARKLRNERHYLSDYNNSEWDITLTMKIGANLSALGLQEGIHWHINPDIKIEYKAADEKRQSIPWVKYTNKKTGKVFIYKDEDNPLSQSELDTLETRTMDCMDCHNRPSHNYRPPAFFINDAITAGDIPRDLPMIKFASMDILGEDFPTTDSAHKAITDYIYTFYKDNYPEVYANQKDKIDKALNGILKTFDKNIFPEMKVKWSVYPNNIGHLEFMGCFRCHNDRHKTDAGKLISKDCNICHSINAQGPPDNLEVAAVNSSLEFRHPGEDVGDQWKEMLCVDCHTGLNP
ncbi:cytochrome c family protein [Melioribacter roseus P3M-2]|uniref:Cytochrome c family protein n=1 Tax=Melioribacter roseus (strain DSM 23840 / JCM 17771 / VKM B-2668 / P3M-2) TaxID=1191523 RepID=I6ZZN1_MELRP|nr:NapC/NirT family cytochrome c [Melioribacter roseus]AFN74423.1 cytochrome c family protein [Melioribacter roseus P3M-2]